MNPSENPWPIVIVCLICAVGLLILWSQQKRAGFLFAIPALLLIALGAWSYDQMVVTKTEQVTEDVRGIVTAFQQRDLDRTLSYISNSARDLKLLAASAYNLVQLGPDTRITDIRVEFPRSERAKTLFRVNSTLQGQGGSSRMSTMWEARWHLENEEWKMIDITQCDPITGERQPLPAEWRHTLNTMYPQK